jgi:hypothetical protein
MDQLPTLSHIPTGVGMAEAPERLGKFGFEQQDLHV